MYDPTNWEPFLPAIPPQDYAGSIHDWNEALIKRGLMKPGGWYGDVKINNSTYDEILEETEMIEHEDEKIPNDDPIVTIIEDVLAEQAKASDFWYSFDKKNTANDWVMLICKYATESVSSSEPFDKELFRNKITKCAGLCMNALRAMSNGDIQPRHYDMKE